MDRADDRRERIGNLVADFAALRRRNVFNAVVGGCRWVEECASGNVHLHAIVRTDGRDLDGPAIAAAWSAIAGAAEVIVKAIDSDEYRRNVCYYVKPTADVPADNRETFKRETKGLRLVATFGDFRGEPLLPRYTQSSATDQEQQQKTAATPLEYIGTQSRISISDPFALYGMNDELKRMKSSCGASGNALNASNSDSPSDPGDAADAIAEWLVTLAPY